MSKNSITQTVETVYVYANTSDHGLAIYINNQSVALTRKQTKKFVKMVNREAKLARKGIK